MKPIKKAIETIQTLGTENKQLKDELDLLRDDYDLQCQCRDGYRADNARLREALRGIAVTFDCTCDSMGLCPNCIAREALNNKGVTNDE